MSTSSEISSVLTAQYIRYAAFAEELNILATASESWVSSPFSAQSSDQEGRLDAMQGIVWRLTLIGNDIRTITWDLDFND